MDMEKFIMKKEITEEEKEKLEEISKAKNDELMSSSAGCRLQAFKEQ